MSGETRKGGLGRGLAALITSTPQAGEQIGDSAADIVFGGARSQEPQSGSSPATAGSSDATGAAAKGTAGAGQGGTGGRASSLVARDASGARINPILAEAAAQHGEGGASHTQVGASGARGVSAQEEEFGASYREVPIGLIVPNEKNPRSVFDPDELGELVHSIREFGLLQPIVVREREGRFEIIMGERRWRAASKAGLRSIPAIVRATDDADMLRDALLENIHRVQLNPLEEAAAYQQLLEEFGVTQKELAEKLGRSRPVVTNMIRLLTLPVEVQQKVAAGVLSAGHARALLGLQQGAAAQAALAQRIIAEGLSVRATEEAVTLMNRGEQPRRAPRTPTPTPEYLTSAAERLADDLDTKVRVQMGKRKGKIVVEFGGQEDFERIMSLLRHS